MRDFSPSMLLYGVLSLFRTNFPRCHVLLSFVTSSLASPIHHPNCWALIKAERNGWRPVSFLQNYLRRRTFMQRQSQSTVVAQEKIAAELMNVEDPTGKTTSDILMRKQPYNLGAFGAKADGLEQLQDFLASNSLGAKDNNKSSLVDQRLCESKIYVGRSSLCHFHRNQPEKEHKHTPRQALFLAQAHTYTCMHAGMYSMGLSLSLSLSLSL